MNWSLLLLLFLLITLVVEVPKLLRLHSLKDTLVFFGVWGMALAATAADMIGLPQFRPLDWVALLLNLAAG